VSSASNSVVVFDSLRAAVREYLAHYHTERNHQGLGNRLVTPTAVETKQTGTVQRKKRLGGTRSYYYRDAA
jgi:putative transposase